VPCNIINVEINTIDSNNLSSKLKCQAVILREYAVLFSDQKVHQQSLKHSESACMHIYQSSQSSKLRILHVFGQMQWQHAISQGCQCRERISAECCTILWHYCEYSSLVPWDISLTETVWKCALGGFSAYHEIVHSLVRNRFPLSSSSSPQVVISQNGADLTDLETSVNQSADSYEHLTEHFLESN
jgi:hypothetical protein